MFNNKDGQNSNQLQENFYIIYKDGQFVLTNTKTHISYALTEEKLKILADEKAALEDEDFIEAGIVAPGLLKSEWPFAPISKLFKESVMIYQSEVDMLSGKEFWNDYLGECTNILNNVTEKTLPDCLKILPLPSAREIKIDFYQGLKQRRTIREFYNQTVSIQELSDILFTTFGPFHEGFGEKYMDVKNTLSWRRSSPSAGGLHSISAYLFIHNVEGIERGVYLYDDQNHNLRLIKNGFDQEQLVHVMMGQRFFQNAAFHIVTVGDLSLVYKKYRHSRALLFPYMENGHLIQTAWLSALSLDLKCWMSAAFCDDFLINQFNLKEYQVPITSFSVGHGCDESLGPKIRQELDEIGYDRQFVAMMAMAKATKEKVQLK